MGLAWSNDSERYADGSVATGRGSRATQDKGDDSDKKAYAGPPDWGLGVGLQSQIGKDFFFSKAYKTGKKFWKRLKSN